MFVDKTVKIADKCCLNCANLLRCKEALEYKCKKYEKVQPDKSDLSTQYRMVLERVIESLKLLDLVETGMKIAEKTAQMPKEEAPPTPEEQKPARAQSRCRQYHLTLFAP